MVGRAMFGVLVSLVALVGVQSHAYAGDSDAIELGLLHPGSGSTGIHMGWEVSLDGDRLVSSATHEEVGGEWRAGALHVFERVQGAWTEQVKLSALDPLDSAFLGWSADLAGNLIAAGAPGVQAYTGAAYVFQEVGGSWAQVARLTAADEVTGDSFGSAIAVDGDTVVVGANTHMHGATRSGAAYVFKRNGGSWDQVAELLPGDGADLDFFGYAVDIEGDRIAIGSIFAEAPGVTDAGAVYMYERVSNVWTHTAKLLAASPTEGDYFGFSVSLDGDALAVGAPASNTATHTDAGRAYVFTYDGIAWSQEAAFHGSHTTSNDFFAESLSLDGDALLVGSSDDEFPVPLTSGLAYLFTRDAGSWQEAARIHAGDGQNGDNFGVSVALDGHRAAVGADGWDNGPGSGTGTVYLFALPVGAPPGADYCFGSSCPCGNDDAAAGCANSSGAGAHLLALGSASVAAADFHLGGTNLLPNQPALLFAGTNATGGGAGVWFGDGLRCAGGSVQRLGVRTPNTYRCASWTGDLAGGAGWSAGDTRYFQVWYRDPAGGPCSNGFNLTQAVELTFQP